MSLKNECKTCRKDSLKTQITECNNCNKEFEKAYDDKCRKCREEESKAKERYEQEKFTKRFIWIVFTLIIAIPLLIPSYYSTDVIISYGGEIEFEVSNWWGFNKKYYPIKIINGEWCYLENSEWKEISYDDAEYEGEVYDY